MARVTGRRTVTVVPRPGVVRISTLPPSVRTRVYTASTPTPRPEMSVTRSAVENPGRATRRISSSSLTSRAASSTSPMARAFSSTRARSIPRPSSLTRITTDERSRSALSVRRPGRGFPAATRSSGISTP